MISWQELDKRIRRQYPEVLRAVVQGRQLFPLYIRANTRADADFATGHQRLEELYQHSIHHSPHGYHIDTQPVRTRSHSLQDMPVAFYFDTVENYTAYLGKQDEYADFEANVALSLEAFPQLRDWLATHVQQVVQHSAVWPMVLEVLRFFSQHPQPRVYARQIAIPGMPTKLIEQHRALLYALLNQVLPPQAINPAYEGAAQLEGRFGLLTDAPRIRLRWLDEGLATRYTGGFTDVSLPVPQLAAADWQVPTVLVVENKVSLLHAELVLSLPQVPHSLVLFGSGRAAALLSSLSFLHHARLLYWGDIDAEGFEILDQLRSNLPHARSFCMDQATWQAHHTQAVPGSGAPARSLPHLTQAEQSLYAYVCTHNLRLEQELLGNDWVSQRIVQIQEA